MRINRHGQYALLLTFYLCRSGQTNLKAVSENLGLSLAFLEQVARKLRIAGVIKSVRGPGGGYSLRIDPTVKEVLQAVTNIQVIKESENTAYRRKSPEYRTLAFFAGKMSTAMRTVLDRRVRTVGEELTKSETQLLTVRHLETGH